jgi:hypothetical protein
VYLLFLKTIMDGIMSQGVKELEQYRKDFQPLSRKAAMLAFCADCMNLFQDGNIDCENKRCPLFPFRPYKKNKSKKEIHLME